MIKFYFVKTRRFLTLWLFLAGLLLGCAKAYAQGGGSAAGLVLVSSTDFSVSGAESKSFNVIDSVNGFKGIFSPEISVGEDFSLPSDVYTDPSETTFLSGKHYGISYRSHFLDTLRFARTTDDWGIVFSSGDKSVLSNTLLLNYRVGGLKIGGKYRVEIEVCNPHSALYLEPSGWSNKNPHLNSAYQSILKVGTNNSKKLPDGIDVMVPNYADSSRIYTISSSASLDSRQGPISNGTLDVNVYMYVSVPNSAVKIKRIKVYAEVDPMIVGQSSECVGGKKATFGLKDTYNDCTYQWYKDGKAISGATEPTYTHITGNVDDQKYSYYCEITTAEGEKIKSRTWTFVDRICCIDDNGKPVGEKLIWQDDFGTFTEKGKYWIWDYSDINNPVKVEKTTKDGWTYELPYSIPGAIYDSNLDVGEGKYSVAANVTNESASDGTKWGWQTITFYGKYLASGSMSPGENTYISPYDYAPDHTVSSVDAPKGYGAMLFLNCGNEAGETIYSRTLSGLSKYSGKKFTAKCYVSTWSNASVPIQICIRVTDLNTGTSYTSETVERYAYHSGVSEYDVRTAWDEVSASIELTGEDPKMKLEVISKGGGADNNQKGNDLLLDDIQIWTCDDDTTKPNISDCPIIGQTSECVGGKKATFGLKDTYTDCTYQWYKDGKAIRGATEPSYTHTTGNVDEQEYEFYCEITTATGEKGKSKTWKFKDRKCCIDDNGNPIAAEKLVWQDDFGTFTEEGQYWVWDYSDINNPVKVEKTTKDGWTYELSDSIPGAEYDSDVDKGEGSYSVASNVTCVYDGATDGTQWGWQAYTFNGESPKKNGYTFAPDHTYQGTEYGAMLFLNCGNEANTVIYERTITDLSEGEYTAKCYINNWSQSSLPVAIAIRVTDLNSDNSYTSETVKRNSVGNGVAWKEVSAKILLTGDKPSLKLEIISVAGGNETNVSGNDLLLDDIQLWTCDPGSLSTVESIAVNDDEIVNVYTISGALVKTNVKKSEALKGLSNGSYIVGNQKVVVR